MRALAIVLLVVACGNGDKPASKAPAATSTTTTTSTSRLTEKEKPPALEPITPQEWVSRVQTYNKRAAAMTASTTVDERFELGQWAWDNGIEDEAWEQWLLVVDAEPDHAAARAAMGMVKTDDGWHRPGKLSPKWLEKVRANGRALSFTLAIEDDASDEFLAAWQWKLRRANWFIWDITEGQVFFEKVEIVDNSSDGRFVVDSGKMDITLLEGGGAFCLNPGRDNWQVRTAGRVYIRILAHELFHGIFGLPDERHGCACLMQGGLFGIRTDQLQLCDKDTHRESDVTPTPCWDIISARHENITHPNTADYGRAPEIQFKVSNN